MGNTLRRGIPHTSAFMHVQGTAEFIDDRTILPGELHCEIFFSPLAHGKLRRAGSKAKTGSAEAQEPLPGFHEALRLPGICAIFTARDLAHNLWGPIVQDQALLAENQVQYLGEPLAVIAGENLQAVRQAKNLLLSRCEDRMQEQIPVLTIEQAIQANSFLSPEEKIERGDPAKCWGAADDILAGEFYSGGQEQFYFESQAAIAYLDENGTLMVHSSSQHPTEVQHLVAASLGLAQHQVVCQVKRMGGAFGGKESQASHIAALAALVAHKTGRAARLILTKDDDMLITGKRHPFFSRYKVSVSGDGILKALDIAFYADGGAYTDLSPAILQRCMCHCDNAYYIENMKVTGRICKTNTAPNTAFRGFGGPQGVAVIESIIEDIAVKLKVDPLELRKKNSYRPGHITTHYGQEVENNILPELFARLEKDCDYQERRAEIMREQAATSMFYRGISLTAVKFGVSFTARFLNQANALVNLHRDGTVQVSTGATEMGQGVNAKIQQIVAESFGVPAEHVRVMTTSTEKNHNTSATAASSGSDLNGAAARIACEKIKARLAAVVQAFWAGHMEDGSYEIDIDQALAHNREANGPGRSKVHGSEKVRFENQMIVSTASSRKNIPLQQAVELAFHQRVSLGDYGFYRTPGIFYDRVHGRGRPFYYYTMGVACSEVKIDRFTGEVKVPRVDILLDLARPINLGIDYGQTAGGFVQGMGWVTTESLYYDEKGRLISCSPATYKIPNVQDTPRQFNIRFHENNLNEKNIRGSKAVGEPPLLLAVSVFTAVKDALARALQKPVDLKLPAQQEEIMRVLRG